jgi:hypothetical protein
VKVLLAEVMTCLWGAPQDDDASAFCAVWITALPGAASTFTAVPPAGDPLRFPDTR